MTGTRFGSRTRTAAGAAVSIVLAASMAASTQPALPVQAQSTGTQVPASRTLVAHLVTTSTSSSTVAAPRAVPLRVRNAAQYADAKATANRRYAAWAAAQPGAPAAQTTPSIASLSKPGLTATQSGGSTPPDTTGAVGPASYVEFVNSEIAVYNRTTLASPPLAAATEDAFTGSTSTCDGQIKWDQNAQRFEYWSLDCAAAAGQNGFSFGWSKTSSPTPLVGSGANWCRFHLGTAANLEDYGKLGNDNGFMIVGANEFNDTSGYTGSPIFAIPKPASRSVTQCPTSVSLTEFVPAAANEFTPVPANIYGNSTTGYIVAISGSLTNALRMYTLVGSTPTLTDNGNITVPAFATPASVPQPGTSDTLDSSDTRLTQANAAVDPTYSAYGIWTQHTVAGPGNGPSVVRWYELKAGRPTPLQTGTIAVSGAFAFNGAIAPASVGNAAAIDYNVGSSTLDVEVRAQAHPFGSAAGAMSGEVTLGTSAGVDGDFSCPSQAGTASCRWGDYAGASTDPLGCGSSVWGTNELNGAPDGLADAQWESQNFRLLADECPTGVFVVSTASPTHGAPVQFDASRSADVDGSIVSYSWRFGDGTTQTSTTPTVAHTYAAAGTYKVTLVVRDAAGLIAMAIHSVVVS